MREEENIRAVEGLAVDWMGFIFYPESSRYAGENLEYIPATVKRVGVFVDEQPDRIRERALQNRLQMLQLHGTESPEYCKALRNDGFLVMKSFGIETDKPFPAAHVQLYEDCCDYFLFDTKTPLYGGSGKKFNWDVLSEYRGKTPFLLSGGISPDDAEPINVFSHGKCIGIDLNSRFETSPGIKDTELLHTFIEKIRK